MVAVLLRRQEYSWKIRTHGLIFGDIKPLILKGHFMKKIVTLAFLAASMFGIYAFAQASPISPQDFFAQVLQAVKDMGGLPGMAKISSVILLLVASMKVNLINSVVWDKLGEFKAILPLLLGILAGLLLLPQVTFPAVLAYLLTGGGAILFHQLLDMAKSVPGLGKIYVYAIDLVEKFLMSAPPSGPAVK